jgi:hypothetical protein
VVTGQTNAASICLSNSLKNFILRHFSWRSSAWRVQVDGVMGGLSTGTLDFSEGKLKFSGDINLNGGGFSSVRRSYSPGKHDLNEGCPNSWYQQE